MSIKGGRAKKRVIYSIVTKWLTYQNTSRLTSMRLHSSVSLASPTQSAPAPSGAGFVQVLDRDLTPSIPHVLVQLDQAAHSVKFPFLSVEKISVQCKYMYRMRDGKTSCLREEQSACIYRNVGTV